MKSLSLSVFYMRFTIVILTVCCYLDSCLSSILVEDLKTNETSVVTIYNALPWDISKATTAQFPSTSPLISKVPMIRIDSPYGEYNPCDASTFDPKFIEPLLKSILGNDTAVGNVPWIASVNYNTIRENCNGIPPLHLLYCTYITLQAQLLGANGLHWSYNRIPELVSVNVPPGVNTIENTVYGVKIDIPGFTTLDDDSKLLSKNLELSPADQNLFIDILEVDSNPFSTVFQQFGAYRIFWFILATFSIVLGTFIVLHINDVFEYFRFKDDQPSEVALIMRLLILIPELINCVCRSFMCIDPGGAFFIYDYFQSRTLFNLSAALSTFTDFVTIFYCRDVYVVYKNSRNMRNSAPFLLKYRKLGTFIFSCAFGMIILDQVILQLSLVGQLGALSIVAIPLLYLIIVNFTVVTVLLITTCLMNREVSAVLETLTDATSKLTNNNGSTKKGTGASLFLAGTITGSSGSSGGPKRNIWRTKHENQLRIVAEEAKKHFELHSNGSDSKAIHPTIGAKTGTAGGTLTIPMMTSASDPTTTTTSASTRPETEASQKLALMISRTESILKMRKFMLFAALGRSMTITALVLIGGGWFIDPTSYALILLLLGTSNSFSSGAQIMAALQLPHSKSASIMLDSRY